MSVPRAGSASGKRSAGDASIQPIYDTYGRLMPDAFDGFGEAFDALGVDGASNLRGHSGATEDVVEASAASGAQENPA